MNAGTPSRSASRARRPLPALAAGLALAMCGAGLALASPALAAPGASRGGRPSRCRPGVTGVAGIACPSASSCVAVGSAAQTGTAGRPVILLTTDGGGHWAEADGLPAGLASLRGVACASVSRCWVAGSWKGRSPTRPRRCSPPPTAGCTGPARLCPPGCGPWPGSTARPRPAAGLPARQVPARGAGGHRRRRRHLGPAGAARRHRRPQRGLLRQHDPLLGRRVICRRTCGSRGRDHQRGPDLDHGRHHRHPRPGRDLLRGRRSLPRVGPGFDPAEHRGGGGHR